MNFTRENARQALGKAERKLEAIFGERLVGSYSAAFTSVAEKNVIGAAGLQTMAFQALICVLAAAFINLAWARIINYTLLSASNNKYKYFRFVREDDDDE